MAGGGEQPNMFRALSNEINVAGIMRWTWKTYHRQPVLVAATAMAVLGCGAMYVASDRDNKERQKYKEGFVSYD
ncbi:hypothetical protein PTSG_01521 [Salpingoeca rosetta]|uniref:HIG1 domain-containing protein n=1 Tax=Salpingoeca rosetta (strain ATCC 50818 / BSB-021) TaxID=946362 RepID=F2U0L0_SALR5|nr:uncharacterized protein PTSG_01521 [Salpingoeca rosetta]EGD80938.1 hypothetical protein PTSG_01521 [Salpingoeca rosetta]|eukprot:XP_004997499.1 hypothetical protein PTSG_01521 [Salpingoeca rosetta]